MLLNEVVTAALKRLDDEAEDYWHRGELEAYVRDGYDQFARRTKCIFDLIVIENVYPTGGYGSDLQRYLSEHSPGMEIHDRRILFTQADGRDRTRDPIAVGDGVAITATVASQAGGAVPGGFLPDSVVDVLRVSWHRRTLVQETPQSLRRKDPIYEIKQGDPQAWLWGEDGLLFVRIWPMPAGDAPYDTFSGDVWGDESYCDDGATVDLGTDGVWGILSGASDEFPSGGPWGTAGRLHPDLKNIRLEVARLGRDPASYDLEIPRSFCKYITFWTIAKALQREGPGQDLKLAQHFFDRFEYGIARMTARLQRIQPERRGEIGGGRDVDRFHLKITLPSYWGTPQRFGG